MDREEWRLEGETSEQLPTGTVTFVLSDVVGSTAMWEAAPEAAAETIATLDGLVDKLVDRHDGARPIEQGEGDSFVAAFARAPDAAHFAIALQRSLATVEWPRTPPALRMALHTGDARLQDGLYRGETLNRCARIRALANGGQVLVSGTTSELVVDTLDEGLFLKDLGTHRLRDLSRAEHLRQLCATDLAIEFPALRSLDRMPHNLPLQLSSFVGREHEMREIADLLEANRLVTLTGAGGCGKTRVALQLAANLLDRHVDGSWFIDLASIADATLVARAFADVLAVHEMPLQDVVSALEIWLRDRDVLLIVDNCEHLLDECAAVLGRILAVCPNVAVLATSREAIGIPGEVAYRVPSLPLPAPDAIDSAAVELFAARASAVRPTFRMTSENAEAIAAICRRLDGLPLAIELAATRCRAMSPQQIASQLAERFSLLSGGARTAVARQRTLEASVAWSFDLLDDDERTLLRRLSVFSGSFTLEAAEGVGAFDLEDAWRVVDMLTGLVDKSLVQLEESDDAVRYRLLETVRHFAEQLLITSGESVAARDAHAQYFVRAATDWTHATLDHEKMNLWNALAWLVDQHDGDLAMALAATIGLMWSRNASSEVLGALQRVLALDGGDARHRARVLVVTMEVAWIIGDLDTNGELNAALRTHLEAHELPEFADFPILFGAYRDLLIGVPGAGDVMLECASRLRELGNYFYSSDAYFGAAAVAMEEGDYFRAAEHLANSLADARRSGDAIALARSTSLAGSNKMQLGDYDGARELLDEILAYEGRARDVSIELLAGGWRAFVDAATGGYDVAIDRAAGVIAQAQRAGLPMQIGWAQWVDVLARRWTGNTDGLDERLGECATIMRFVGLEWATAWCDAARGELAIAHGDVSAATVLIEEALELTRTHPYARYSLSDCLRQRAQLRRTIGAEGADDDAREALAVAASGGLLIQSLDALELVALISMERGNTEEAARLFGAAANLRDTHGAPVPPIAVDDLKHARAQLAETLGDERFRELHAEGARLDLAGAAEYAARGRGTRRRAASGWPSLTPVELQVVELVAEGRKNAEIAEQLFITVSTVKTHLAHIFTKLSVSTRAELAARAASEPRN